MACEGIQVQPGCCCSAAFEVNFEAGEFPGCTFIKRELLDALSPGNIDLLSEYRMLILQPSNSLYICGDTIYQYTAPQSTKIKDWVEAGGRLVAPIPNPGCLDFTWPTPTPNLDNFNNFMGFLGSSIQMPAFPEVCGRSVCSINPNVTDEPIVSGLSIGGIVTQGYGTLTGGVPLCKVDTTEGLCDPDDVFFSAEKIGDGVVFVTADPGMIWNCFSTGTNCELFSRICNMPINSMFNP